MKTFLKALSKELEILDLPVEPANLYDPLRYFLSLGGKRTRPCLLLLAHELFDDNWQKSLPQAVAIELFHNFTLIHDDIMDKAALRRAQATVHVKWNEDIAILSGDVLFVKAYDYLIGGHPTDLKETVETFNETGRLVCEGQQYDMDFESRSDVRLDEYMEMIRLKTAVLLGCSLKIGALNGGASLEHANLMYDVGVKLGIGFQLQDDYLDAFGDPKTFGKQVGGDIMNNKMTYLSIQLQKTIGEEAFQKLCDINDMAEKVAQTKSAIQANGIDNELLEKVEHFHNSALDLLALVPTKKSKEKLLGLASTLMVRTI